MPSGRKLAEEYAARVENWIAERDAIGDYAEYERDRKVNRTALCAELDFGRSVLTQNPSVRAQLLEAERRWFGTRQPDTNGSHDAARERAELKSTRISRELRTALDENARLRAENTLLRQRLRKYETLEQILTETGRLPRT